MNKWKQYEQLKKQIVATSWQEYEEAVRKIVKELGI
jgi:hypothetical protein